MSFHLPRIYPITDTRASAISHAGQVERLVAGGARIIQLREKSAPAGEFYQSSALAVEVARKYGVRIIINDRVDIALTLKSGGVHLGQNDLPPEKAREILGPDAIIGFSTHTLEQARKACDLPVDYIALGPIFPTRSKTDPDAAIGLKELIKVRAAIGDKPLVAIGGINRENLIQVFASGADSAAIIGSIISDGARIEERMRQFTNLAA